MARSLTGAMYRAKGSLLLLVGVLLAALFSGCMETQEEGDEDDVGGDASPSPTPTETTDEGDGTEESPASGSFTVSMIEFEFQPEEVWVEAGTTVTWENDGQVVHTATASDDAWDTGDVSPGESADIVFDEEGTYDYRCVYHVAQGMVGTVHVV